MTLTVERLKECLSYDAGTGVFTRISSSSRRHSDFVGLRAGTVTDHGYRKILIDGRLYREHRLAWLYTFGVWPDGHIDHINMDRADNRISNLRVCTPSQNHANTRPLPASKSGSKGVYHRKARRPWYSMIMVRGTKIYLGSFFTKEEATKAYADAATAYFGEFSRLS